MHFNYAILCASTQHIRMTSRPTVRETFFPLHKFVKIADFLPNYSPWWKTKQCLTIFLINIHDVTLNQHSSFICLKLTIISANWYLGSAQVNKSSLALHGLCMDTTFHCLNVSSNICVSYLLCKFY